jgi:hypothetical protein
VLDLQFTATSPLQSQPADGFVQMGAVFTPEQDHPSKGVRVRASEECDRGKAYSRRQAGQYHRRQLQGLHRQEICREAQVGQPNVIREEDLPKVLRCINPSRGIRGITHDSNRLNLILSDDDTIVQAYWE